MLIARQRLENFATNAAWTPCTPAPSPALLRARGGGEKGRITRITDGFAPPRGKHAVDHAATEVRMGIQRRAEAVHEAHRTDPAGARAGALAQARFDERAEMVTEPGWS